MERETQKELLRLEKDKIKAKQKERYKEVAEICNYKGVLYSSKCYFSEALEEHKEELKYCRLNKDVLGEAIAYRKIGECFAEMEQFEKALKNHARYLKLAETLKNEVEIQRAWTTLGRTYLLQYSSDSSNKQILDFAETAIKQSLLSTEKLKNEVKERDFNEMACRSYLNLALVYEAKEKNKCIQFFEKAMLIAKKFGFKEDLNRCQLSLGNYYFKIEDFTLAMKVFDDAIKIAKELKNKAQLCDAYLSKGQTLLFTTDFAGASYYFKKAYFSCSTVEDDRQKARRFSKYTSCVVKYLKHLNEAVSAEKKMEICEKLGDSLTVLKCYGSAIKYYEKQLHYAKSSKMKSDVIATIHVSLGQTFLDNKQYAEALHHFTEEREIRKGNLDEEVNSSLKIVETMIAFGTRKEDIHQEYDQMIAKCVENRKLKRAVLEDYISFLKHEVNCSNKINEIERMLAELPNNDNEDIEEVQIDSDENLSEPSAFSDSDSDNEETYNRKSRRKRVGRNEKGETPLHKACIEGNIRQVKQLVEKGHSVNERDNCGWLPIHEAANFGFAEIVEYLVDNGADINDRGGKFCEGITPLHDACINGHSDVIRVLVRKGANVASHDNNGKTAFDCLKDYYSRAKNLSKSEKTELKFVLSELEEAMKKVSYDFNQSKRNSKKRNRTPFEDCREKSPVNAVHTTQRDLELDDPVVSDYAQTISNLRRAVDTNDNKRRRLIPPKSTEPLLDEADVMIDDWLEDDVGLVKNNRNRLRRKDHLREKFDEEEEEMENFDSTDCNFEESANVNEKISIEFCDTASDHIDNFSVGTNVPVASSVSGANGNTRNHDSRDENSKNSNIVVRVFVEDIVLLINAEKGATVKWLAETTAARYYQVKQVLPSVSMKTRDGALLSQSDLVENVALVENGQLYATIESWESQPLNERYVEQCKLLCVDRCHKLEREMRIAFESGNLSLRNFILKESQLKPLLNAIKYQETIESLDISYSNILILDFRNEFLNIVVNLPRLQKLNVECTALTKSKLKVIAHSKCKAFEVNLSYNSFQDSHFNLISDMINNFENLRMLNLQHCEIDSKFITDSSISTALANSSLCTILFDYCPQFATNFSNGEKLNFKCNYTSALKKI